MRLASIIIAVFFISASGLAEQVGISEDMNSHFRTDLREHFINDRRNTQQMARGDRTGTANGYLFYNRLYNTQPETVELAYDHDRTKPLENHDDKSTELEGIADRTMLARAEFSAIDKGGVGQLAINPSPNNDYFKEIVYGIRDVYDSWTTKDGYGSIRLVLLCIGLVGLIGIRRKFKKS